MSKAKNKSDIEITFDDYADELLGEMHIRAIVLLACAKIESQLESILRKYTSTSDKDKRFFEFTGPAGTFSSKIQLIDKMKIAHSSFVDIPGRLRHLR